MCLVQSESSCKHLWIIESPNGPTSIGKCKLCGEQNEFRNSVPVSGWDRVSDAQRGKRSGQGKIVKN